MPVLLFGSVEDLDLILPLASRLRADGGEVRCYLDDDAYELRNIGCKLALGQLDDESNLEGALSGVHTYIPFLVDPARIENEEHIDALIRMGIAAAAGGADANIQQTILPVPHLPSIESPLSGAYGVIEEEFSNQIRPLCTFRIGFVWGPSRPFTEAVAGMNLSLAAESQVSVARVEDLVRLLAAADDRESTHGTWEFGATASLAKLKGELADGASRSPSPWLLELLKSGASGGSGASEVFGVRAESPV
jgi:hypothetical protein